MDRTSLNSRRVSRRGPFYGRCASAVASALLLTAAFVTGAAAEPARPARIVSLDLCADQILIELVARRRISAVTHLAADPSVSAIAEKARGYPVTRGAAEDVLQHDPDLVLAGPYGVSSTVSLLQRVGRNVVIVPLASDLDGVRRAIRTVADATGDAEAGTAMIAAFDTRLATIARETAASPAPAPTALVYQVGGSISLEGTLADAALAAAGFTNAGRNFVHARGGQVPLEALVAHPPDLLVLASPPLAYRTIVADNLRHPALRQLTQRVASIELPWRLWLCGTAHVGDAIEELAAARRRLAGGATQ